MAVILAKAGIQFVTPMKCAHYGPDSGCRWNGGISEFPYLHLLWQMTRNCGNTYANQYTVVYSLNQLTRLFKALSHVTRLRVVNLLHLQSFCVGDLAEVLGVPQPIISHELGVLRAAKLVCIERQGKRVCYSLARAPFLNYPLGRFLSEMVPFFPELAADIQKLADLKGDSVSCSSLKEEPQGVA